jgi:hypothetical protein
MVIVENVLSVKVKGQSFRAHDLACVLAEPKTVSQRGKPFENNVTITGIRKRSVVYEALQQRSCHNRSPP